MTHGSTARTLLLVCAGTVHASVTGPGGRRVAFKVAGAGAYGLLPLLDGRKLPNDVVAIEPVTALAVPYTAIRTELSRDPALWESLAVEMGVRARAAMEQMKRFVFDPPYLHMAALLVELAERKTGSRNGPATPELRLPQERLAEMLGVSRQWATRLVRDMTRDGLVEWRYGRVTLLDLRRLRALARQGINP